MAGYVTCSLCGFEFEKIDTSCSHGCPLAGVCNLVQCPNCHYEFAEAPRSVSWLRRLLHRERPRRVPLPEHVRVLSAIGDGVRATVVCLGAGGESRHNSLAVFGLVPGAEVTLLQHRPSPVVRVGETTLALDREIADEIVVTPLGADTGPAAAGAVEPTAGLDAPAREADLASEVR